MDKIKKEYYDNGNIKCEMYLEHGKVHRLDGPAFIEYDEIQYCIYIS